MIAARPANRPALVRRSRLLNYATLAYNSLECAVSIGAGLLAGSIALVGFGVDSLIELTASVAALWRLRADLDPARRERAEQQALRVIGFCFLGLAAYVSFEAVRALAVRSAPERSPLGIGLAVASLVVMPLLARAKRAIAIQLDSAALAAEAKQTLLCTYLSAILLAGLGLNALWGWWWADPVAGLAMVPLIVREGIEGIRSRSACG
jgi:divalent metal cation (Fe/Co/Zn/Cd) transporter